MTTYNEKLRAGYAQRRAEGRCIVVSCGAESPRYARCDDCRQAGKAAYAERRQQLAAARCFRCRGPLDDKSKRNCAACRTKELRAQMKIYHRRAEEGVCRSCGGVRESLDTFCRQCRAVFTAHVHKRAAERWARAECVRCSRPLESLAYRTCRPCLDRLTARRHWRQDWRVAQSLALIGRRIQDETAAARSAPLPAIPTPPREPAPSLAVGWKIAVALAETHQCRQCREFLTKARAVRKKVYAPIRRRMMKRLLRGHEQRNGDGKDGPGFPFARE